MIQNNGVQNSDGMILLEGITLEPPVPSRGWFFEGHLGVKIC
jgi:hypothetical protein